MLVELSPVAYLALCGLVRDALEIESDAAPLLKRVADELARGAEEVSAEFEEQPDHAEALRRGGFLGR